jgi:hypothetical protein
MFKAQRYSKLEVLRKFSAQKVSPFQKVKPLNADFARINRGKAKPFF